MIYPKFSSAGITELAENLYSINIPLPRNPLRNLNAYVILGERNLIVDTGFRQPECRQALVEGLRALQVDMARTDIFLTHLHADHAGLAPDIIAPTGNIYIGERDLKHLPGPDSDFSWDQSNLRYAKEGFPVDLLQKLIRENPAQAFSPAYYERYCPVRDGDRFRCGSYDFRAIHTPGHTPGHMILFDENTGTALLGDHVLFDITPNISRWAGSEDSLGDYLRSLKRVSSLPLQLPLPAHREVHMDFHARCEELIAHHGRRCEEVLRILESGGTMNAWTIASRMTWKIRANSWEDFPNAQKWFAVGEALAHLDHLIALGKVRKLTTPDGQNYYTL